MIAEFGRTVTATGVRTFELGSRSRRHYVLTPALQSCTYRPSKLQRTIGKQASRRTCRSVASELFLQCVRRLRVMEEEKVRYRSVPARRRAAPATVVPVDSAPAWLTISQLCRRWQLDRKTIYKFIDANLLPAWRVGPHLYRVSVANVLRFEGQNRLLPK